MNYEELYDSLQATLKKFKDVSTQTVKCQKNVNKAIEDGDLKTALTLLDDLNKLIGEETVIRDNLLSLIKGFDSKNYFSQGDFAKQLIELAKENNIDVIGESPTYEMFPYKIKLDIENQDVYIDRKKMQCMRPKSLISSLKVGLDKLNKVSFNGLPFLNELYEAYETAVLKSGKKVGTDILLSNVYKYLVPMSRSKKEYDQQSFAFDLARLFAQQEEERVIQTKNGLYFRFGPGRDIKNAIRILDSHGNEQYLSTICFYKN